jgi:hypothetical protein
MGWFDIALDPWIWSEDLDQFVYTQEDMFSTSGSWIYIPLVDTPPPGGDGTWGGYPLESTFYVDTGSPLGLLYVGDDPWVYSFGLARFLHLPESLVTEQGAWVYFFE